MATTTASVEQLYVAYFNRPADPAGLAFWMDVLAKNPNGLDMISANFAKVPEYQRTYAGMDNLSIVKAVYHNLFGREGEAGGVQFWTDRLNAHDVTIDNIVKYFTEAASGNDRVVLNGRTSVATVFTQHLDTQAEINAFNTDAGMVKAKAFIGTIVDLQSGAAAIDPGVIDAKIAEIVGVSSNMGNVDHVA